MKVVPWKPTSEQLKAAADATEPDIIGPGFRILFCGINPSLYSAAIGHHFGRPGNRFWPTLHGAGFTDRLVSPFEDETLATLGLGVTNLVARATSAADQLSSNELEAGRRLLVRKIRKFRPRFLAILGVGAYRTAFAAPGAVIGQQSKNIGSTRIWVLPNPSGLNAHYQLEALIRGFIQLREAGQEPA